jgi:anti-sigma regulatory factor (Ser/Thr protein kinase)
MAPTVARESDATQDLATMTGAAVLGTFTIPGRPQYVRAARTFVAQALGELSHITVTDTAVLLASELVTNAVRHSNSGTPGGTVTVMVLHTADGIGVEVRDDGSDISSPVVKDDVLSTGGHGLLLVESIAQQWGYLRDEAGTTVWFWLAACGLAGLGSFR